MAALEAGFSEYASQFFKLSLEQMNEVAADTPGVKVSCVSKCKQMDEPLYVHDPSFSHAPLAPCHLNHTLHTSPQLSRLGSGPANDLGSVSL